MCLGSWGEVIAPISPRGMSDELALQSMSPQSRPLKIKANYLQFKKSWDCLLNTYSSLQMACCSHWCLPPLTHWLRKWGHETRTSIMSPGHSHSAFSNTPRRQPFKNKFLNVLDTKQSLCGKQLTDMRNHFLNMCIKYITYHNYTPLVMY